MIYKSSGMLRLLVLIVTLALISPGLTFYLESKLNNEQEHVERDSFVNESTISYQLFTRSNPDTVQILHLDDQDALEQSNFNPSVPTKVWVHGWGGSPRDSYSARNGYLAVEDCNFIAMNWTDMSSGPLPPPTDYPYIVEVNVPKAGRHLGSFVSFLIERTGADISSFHLMGWSLGSHVVGGAGATVSATFGRKIPRITGMDPAGPFFPLNDTSSRLDISDADFVDIIHTDSGDLTGNELGMEEPIGHIDFYPNGGADQPGCFHIGNETSSHETRSNCDHARAPRFFAESITSEIGFRAVECDSFESFTAGLCEGNPSVLMGEPTPSTARGIYYLATNSESPYALG